MLKHLIEIELTATHRFANEDIYLSDVLYQGKLMDEVGISAMLPDSFYGIEEPQSVTIRLANVDGYFTTLVNSEELRGKTVYIRRNEDGTNTESWRGIITACDIADEAKITVLLKNPDPLQAMLPKTTLTTGLWSNVPEKDLGKPFPILLGHCERVPCIYVGADITNNYYDYVIGHGPVESLTKLYRAGVEIAGAEYTFYDGSQGSPYAGYAFVRFVKEQRDFSNSLFEITADVHGLKMGGATAQRNFVRAIQNLLSNSTWGLGLSVNATSFDTAASVVIDNSAGTMASLLCDGDINSQEKAQDILDRLLWCCRGSLSTNLSGQYEINIDTYKATSSATFGSGDGYYDNIVSIKSRRKTATNEAFKSLTLNYRKNNDKGEFKQTQTRPIFSFGEDRIVESPFVRDHTTADKMLCYRQKRALNADERLEIEVGKEGATLKAGDRVTVSIPRMGITSAAYQVEAAQKTLTTFSLTLRSYAQAIYDYVAGTLPSDETVETKAAPTQNKITRSLASAPPSNPGVSDLWYQTDTFLQKRWSGTAWEDVANAYANTTLLTDGAGLGTTAIWSGVTGTGRPADNATQNSTDATLLSRGNHTGTQGASSLDSTVISAGKIIAGLLTADNIQAGTLTGRTIQTASSGKRFVVDTSTNEAHFYGDRGDGTIEELASIGIKTVGGDTVIGAFGTQYSSKIAIYALSSTKVAIYGESNSLYGVKGTSYSSTGVFGGSSTEYGIVGSGGKAPLRLIPSIYSDAPTHAADFGALWCTSGGILYINISGSTTWGKVGAQ